jgi:hypothetical protein
LIETLDELRVAMASVMVPNQERVHGLAAGNDYRRYAKSRVILKPTHAGSA